jgi:two-component system CheB/CheR fusion protein
LKIVALTGWTKAENDQRAEEAGFDEHLVKPADRATISRLLRSLSRPEEAARHARPNRPTA